MTKEQIIAKYNPVNAHNLTESDLSEMRNLTDEQIKTLAEAYPNNANRKPYLILYDTKLAENKQLYNLSTWQNLYNVRKFSNMRNLQPFTFKELFQVSRPSRSATVSKRAGSTLAKVPTSARKVVDLSAGEAAAELKQNLPARSTMVAKTAPEPENDKPGTQITKTTAGQKTGNKRTATKVKAVPASAATNSENAPADQQFSDPSENAGGKGTE
jgi:hypothetical protein